MDLASVLLFIFIAVVIYIILKFVVSPLIRVIISVAIILLLIYIASRFFGFSTDTAFGPYGKFLNIKYWPYSNLVTGYIDMAVGQIINFYNYLISILPKST